MIYSVLTTLLLLASSSSLISALPRAHTRSTSGQIANDGTFSVSGFLDTNGPQSTSATVTFNVTDAGATTPLTNVTCSAVLSGTISIATTSFPTNCSDPTVFYGLVAAGQQYFLSIAHVDAAGNHTDSGTISLGNDLVQVVDSTNPNSNYYYLGYASSFAVGYNRY